MKFSMVVFDMAGTTVEDTDNAVASRLCEALAAAGVHLPIPAIDPVMGIPKPLAIQTLLTQVRGFPPRESEVNAIHEDFQARIVHHYQSAPHVREIPGATEAFKFLKSRGVRVTLDTGFDRSILDTIVTRLSWSDLLDDAISSDQVTHGRPHPEMIHVLMQRAGVTNPAEVAKIGDSLSDIEQGLAAKCGLVAAVINQRTTPHLDRFPQAVPVATLSEFVALLTR